MHKTHTGLSDAQAEIEYLKVSELKLWLAWALLGTLMIFSRSTKLYINRYKIKYNPNFDNVIGR